MSVYYRPSRINEAVDLLDEYGDDAKVLAGGQSLIPMMSAGFLRPQVIVDVNYLSDLSSVSVSGGYVHVGALVRHRALELDGVGLGPVAPLLPAGASLISHAAVRNLGTFVGSLVHADPSAEFPAVAVAADVSVRLVSRSGERIVSAVDFFLGPLTCDIRSDEVAVEAVMPVVPPRTGAAVQELAYRDGDYAVVGAVAQLSLDDAGGIADARLVVFAADATPVRISDAELLLRADGVDAISEAAILARGRVHPSSDATASAAYRAEMVPVFCRRALQDALALASAAAPS